MHWWAWGPEALAEAKRTNKPILLSVGYAACHWCHVMAHESFEDAGIAAQMNDLFVNIKVDREERPDIDAIYMRALHNLGEQGGWPLTMFLDSEARPFWGGTYFPPTPRYGRPGFTQVLQEVSRIYAQEPDKVRHNTGLLLEFLAARDDSGGGPAIDDRLLADLTRRMVSAVDPHYGGLSGAPKFPQWSFFWLLWRGAIRYRPRGGPARRRQHAHPHLPGRHLRPSRRRLCPLLGRRALARAALREDALRQRAAPRPDVRGLARDRQRPLRAPHRRDGRLAAARDDRRGRRLRGLARCRLGGRGGQVLRLDESRDRGGAGRGRRQGVRRRLRGDGRRQLGRPHHPQPPAQSRPALARRGGGAGRHAQQAPGAARRIASAPAGTTRCWPTGTA